MAITSTGMGVLNLYGVRVCSFTNITSARTDLII